MDNRFFISSVKVGITDGGIACGPVEGSVIVSVEFKNNNTTKWLTNVETTGIPGFFLTDSDIFERLFVEDFDDDLSKLLDTSYIEEFGGIKLGEYEEIEKSIRENPDSAAKDLIEYIIRLTREDNEETKRLIEAGEGKYIDQIVY